MNTTSEISEFADAVVDVSHLMSMVATGVIGFHVETEGRPPSGPEILDTLAGLLELALPELRGGWSATELAQGSALLRAAGTLIQDGILNGGLGSP